MFVPKKFRSTDINEQIELIKQHPLATLVTQNQDGMEATHIPMVLVEKDGEFWLHGHIARANPIWKTHLGDSPALAIFTGPNCYISPDLYPTKKVDGRVAPTWNYVAVHAKGELEFVNDEAWLMEMWHQLTGAQEAGKASPWQVDDAPQDYLDKMLKAIVGVRIKITEMVGKWKVSQNQPQINQQGVIAGLAEQGGADSQAVAQLVAAKL